MKYTAVYFDSKTGRISHATSVGAAGPGLAVGLHAGPMPGPLKDCFWGRGGLELRRAVRAVFDEAHAGDQPRTATLIADGRDGAVLSGLPHPCRVREGEGKWREVDGGALTVTADAADDYEITVQATGHIETVYRVEAQEPGADHAPAKAARVTGLHVALTRSKAAVTKAAIAALEAETAAADEALKAELSGFHALLRAEAEDVLADDEAEAPLIDAEAEGAGVSRKEAAEAVLAKEADVADRRRALRLEHAKRRFEVAGLSIREKRAFAKARSGRRRAGRMMIEDSEQ